MAKEKGIIDKPQCIFCGKTSEDGVLLIQSLTPGVCICDECIDDCVPIVNERRSSKKKIDAADVLKKGFKPSSLKKFLEQYVIGQDLAKDTLAVAVYNHYKMLAHAESGNPEIELKKSNILLVGPTGSGKTLIASLLAKYLDVPFAISDATSLTAAGFVGDDVENVVRRLVDSANGDIEKAQKGIIYIDEIDKNSRKGENPSLSRDVGGESVQQALLKIIEGALVEVPPKGGRKHPQGEVIKVDTTNILFIVGGSFEGIEKTVSKRTGLNKTGMGFGQNIDKQKTNLTEAYRQITVEDLQKYGMLPEFLGRFPIICPLDEIDEPALLKILTEPKDALVKQYQELLKMDGVELEFTEGALKAIAKEAIKRKTGARALRAIMEEVLRKTMFIVPDDPTITKIIVDENCVTKKEQPVIERKEIV